MLSPRRSFLRQVLWGLFGILRPQHRAWGGEAKALPTKLRGRVCYVKDSKIVDPEGNVREEVVRKWLQAALEDLTGLEGKRAWMELFSVEDKVAIKVNSLGGAKIATSPSVALAIAHCLVDAGLKSSHIIIWDRSSLELRRAGYRISYKGKGPFCLGTDLVGYEPFPRVHGTIGSCFSLILTNWATALVDVAVLKDHDIAGVSLSIKNLFGVIHNPNKYHDSGCSPYLADLLDHPQVKGKFRLAVCDAHRGQCHGGPAYAPRWGWPERALLVSADPVSLDLVGTNIIEERRRRMGLPSLEEEKRPPVHIEVASRRGLGEGRPDKIVIHYLGG